MQIALVGQTIKNVRPMTQAEIDKEGWSYPATVLVLGDGTKLYASRDGEGNDPGVLFGQTNKGECFGL